MSQLTKLIKTNKKLLSYGRFSRLFYSINQVLSDSINSSTDDSSIKINLESKFVSGEKSKFHPTYQPGVPRIIPVNPNCNALEGKLKITPSKSLWFGGMTLSALVGAILTYDSALMIENLSLLFGSTGISILFGHSLGMHRKFIHNSFQCPKWLEYVLVHLGTLMGIAGPIGMMKAHDMRDWAQRQAPKNGQSQCHPYYGQQESLWKDAYSQLCCSLTLKHPPEIILGEKIEKDRVIQWMERTWMLQQLPYAILFYCIGGWSWVIWGVCARVSISVFGHFYVGWYAHNSGSVQSRSYHVEGASIQGYNVESLPNLRKKSLWGRKIQEIMTAGECYHNNHHAYPGSSKLAIKDNELDIGWNVLKVMEKLGLVWNLRMPQDLPPRKELTKIDE